MKHKFIRYSIYSMIVLLIGLGVLAASRANAGDGGHRNEIHVESFAWGVSSGQMVRISVAHYNPFVTTDAVGGATTANDPVIASIQLLGTEGEVIAQSDEISVDQGRIRIWEKTQELPRTMRARISVKFITRKPFDVNRDQSPFAATVEVVDPVTGRTALITTEWVFVA